MQRPDRPPPLHRYRRGGRTLDGAGGRSRPRVVDGPTRPARPSRPLLTEAGDFVDVSRGNPKPFTLKGEALAKARLTPETWRLEVVGDGSSRGRAPGPAGGRHGARPRRAQGARQGARRPVPEGDAVQQHPLPARPGALGGRAAPRGAPAASARSRTSAGSTTGGSTTTTRPSSSSRRSPTTGRWSRPRGSRPRWSPTGSTAGTSRWSAAGRSGWSCPGRTGSSRSSGSSGSS